MTQHYDVKVPSILKKNQQWFAGIITRRIDTDSRMMPISPKGVPMVEEAQDYILPSPTLKSHERIELYNQQYWWRLLTTLQETYPLLTRLFGFYDFNESIAFPYLEKYPPDHWSLSTLGKWLPRWIEEEYSADDKQIIHMAAHIDCAFNEGFIAKEYPRLDLQQFSKENDFSKLLDVKLYLQPHVYLFETGSNLFDFREKLMKEEEEYWIEHDFPNLEHAQFYHVLFRNSRNNMAWEKVGRGEFFLLTLFVEGNSINNACEVLEGQDRKICQEALENLSTWFQKWAVRGWFYSRI